MPSGADSASRLGRRALAVSAAALAVVGPAAAGLTLPPGNALTFRILRDGSEIGSHRIDFDRHGTATIARVAIDIAVTYAWITVYRFAQRAEETWTNGRFSGIESRTDDNGKAAWMRTAGDPARALQVSGSGTEPYAAPPGALPSTYWNPAILDGPLISSQDGRLCLQHVLPGPVENVPCVGGTVLARRHEMHGDLDIQIWYDLDNQWAHLRFRRDGSLITYLRA
jgi:hypothetical protein